MTKKKRFVVTPQKTLLPIEMREKIASYMQKCGVGFLAKMVISGEFRPNYNKWAALFERIEKRKGAANVKLAVDEVQTDQLKDPTDPLQTNEHMNCEIIESLIQTINSAINNEQYKLFEKNLVQYQSDIRLFMQSKWREISSNTRVFGIEQDKIYNLYISDSFLKRLSFNNIRFSQNGYKTPEVCVIFVSSNYGELQCSLRHNGIMIVENDYERLLKAPLKTILNIAAVVYYRDLVCIGPEKLTTNSNEAVMRGKSPDKVRKGNNLIRIPRCNQNYYQSARSFGQRKKSSGYVDPFRRKLPTGQSPSFTKILEADEFGINLKGLKYPDVQYTFVSGHFRGDPTELKLIKAREYRAVKTFETILDFFGLQFPMG